MNVVLHTFSDEEAMLAHIAIAVEELKAAVAIYEALGFEAEEPEIVERERVRLVKLKRDGLCLELLESYPAGSGSIAKFLAKKGPGLHHMAFGTLDLANDLKRLEKSGIQPLIGYPAKGSEGSNVVFLDPRTTGGVLIELVENGTLSTDLTSNPADSETGPT